MRNREKGTAVDYVGHFEREAAAFEAAARRAAGARAAPEVPSCPQWVVTDLVLHLGMVHRLLARLVGERMQEPPARSDPSWQRMQAIEAAVHRWDERYFVLVPPV